MNDYKRFSSNNQRFLKSRHLAALIAIILAVSVLSAAVAADVWNCPECGRTGNTGNYCGGCGHASPDIEGQINAASQEKDKTAGFKTVGNIVTFGRYEQDGEAANGPEEIEWIVLDYDEKEHKALLLSRYGLDAKEYNTEYTDVTWMSCTMRAWLNSTFLNEAFTIQEQDSILLTNVDNSSSQEYSEWKTSGSNNTHDRIFPLSYAEGNRDLDVTRYEKNTKSRVRPTAYAIENGAFTNAKYKTTDDAAAGWWWLRSPGFYQPYAAAVDSGGSLNSNLVSRDLAVVRPALWINLESGIF